jgi:hypothetical protein
VEKGEGLTLEAAKQAIDVAAGVLTGNAVAGVEAF